MKTNSIYYWYYGKRKLDAYSFSSWGGRAAEEHTAAAERLELQAESKQAGLGTEEEPAAAGEEPRSQRYHRP